MIHKIDLFERWLSWPQITWLDIILIPNHASVLLGLSTNRSIQKGTKKDIEKYIITIIYHRMRAIKVILKNNWWGNHYHFILTTEGHKLILSVWRTACLKGCVRKVHPLVADWRMHAAAEGANELLMWSEEWGVRPACWFTPSIPTQHIMEIHSFLIPHERGIQYVADQILRVASFKLCTQKQHAFIII